MNEKLDTRLTDYALGELDDAARAEMQQRLVDDPAARAEADEIARLGQVLRKATVRTPESVEQRNALLQDIIAAHLETQQDRAAAEEAAAAEKVALPPSGGWSRTAYWFAGAAVAASVLLALTFASPFQDNDDLAYLPERMITVRGNTDTDEVRVQEVVPGLNVQVVPSLNPDLFAKLSAGPGTTLGGVNREALPGIAAPNWNTQVMNQPTSVRVDVGTSNVFQGSVVTGRGDYAAPGDVDGNGAVGLDLRGVPVYVQMDSSSSPFGRYGEASIGPRSIAPGLAPPVPNGAGAVAMAIDLGKGAPSDLTFNHTLTYGGVISGAGAVLVNGIVTNSGLFNFNTNTTATYTGATTIASGAKLAIVNGGASGNLTLKGNNTYAGGTEFQAGATLNVGVGGSVAAMPPVSSPAVVHSPRPADPRIENGRIAATPPGPKTFAGVLYPLLLEHEKLVAQYGPKHPRVAELELKVNMVQQHLERDLGSKAAAELASNAPPSEDRLIALLVERRRFAAMYGASHPKTKELDAKYRTEQARYDEFHRMETEAIAARQNTEAYDSIVENPFLKTLDAPLSTFSIDVDTASYSNVRRFLNQGQLPPRGAVRIEEFLNYFSYSYPQPKGTDPFSITTEAARCPWNNTNVLVRVGLKGREIHQKERPATNLVFLVDVSGSMQDQDKLPLVRESLKMMVRELGDNDRVAIVVYAGNTGLVLPSTGGHEKAKILAAIGKLEAGGSTNGGAGIQLAYEIAIENFIKGGVNRVILATDGDFNVGITSESDLVDLIEKQAKTGVFFSGLAYGTGNLKDATLEKLADKGNGNYAYIDSLAEARKVLVEQMSATLVTIAKDVKVQIEFNPARVEAYRLIGYENRVLAAQDFNDDKKDAGEIGAGHTVTALYEVVPVRINAGDVLGNIGLPTIDPLKYQKPKPKPKLEPSEASKSDELLTLKLRYKQPDGDVSKLVERPLKNDVKDYGKASADFKFAAAVASFGMQLRDSQFSGTATFDAVLELAQEGIGRDDGGYRREFIELVRKARDLKPQSTQPQSTQPR